MIDYVMKQKPKAFICQDYIVVDIFDFGAKFQIPFIAVTDGCTGGQRTETGSQLLCHISRIETLKYLEEWDLGRPDTGFGRSDLLEILNRIQNKLTAISTELSFNYDQLLATLQFLFIIDNHVYGIRSGDGVMFTFDKKKIIRTSVIEYTPNMPNYLAYRTNPVAWRDLRTTVHGDPYRPCFKTVTTYESTATEPTTTEDRQDYFEITFIDEELSPDLTHIGLASDGVESYMNESSNQGIPVWGLIKELSEIKNPEGNFLVRRFQKMDKGYHSAGFENKDDVAIAMIDLEAYRRL